MYVNVKFGKVLNVLLQTLQMLIILNAVIFIVKTVLKSSMCLLCSDWRTFSILAIFTRKICLKRNVIFAWVPFKNDVFTRVLN